MATSRGSKGQTETAPAAVRVPHTRRLTIIAKDPGVRLEGGAMLFARITIPAEDLAPGPTGYRVKVVDFDATAGRLYKPLQHYQAPDGTLVDPFRADDGEDVGALAASHQARLLADPNFHAQNTYAIVMRILARFEFALGRRIEWGFNGHQLNVAPHAFLDANAFYSNEDSGLMFGYFKGKSGAMVFTALSHDIVAHETTHALLDGLRDRFTEPSSPDQAAFHEAFADIVALLSVFALPEVVAAILGAPPRGKDDGGKIRGIEPDKLTLAALQSSILAGIAAQLGLELDGLRGNALRQSVLLEPDAGLLASEEFAEPHRRGEVLVAAMMRTALTLWRSRIETLGTLEFEGKGGQYNLDRVIEEGAKVADHLLTMAIRAVDYCPPTDIDFGVYLAAFLTADAELMPDDNRFRYRETLRATFASYGITTPGGGRCADDGSWRGFDAALPVNYARSHFESMLRDKDEVFRFIWDNRRVLGIGTRATIKVGAVRPSIRQSPDGFFVRETVCTYVQIANIFGSEVKSVLGVDRPEELETTRSITAFGGGTIIFDQYGRIKYHIAHPLNDGERQKKRLASLGEIDGGETAFDRRNRFALLHAARASD